MSTSNWMNSLWDGERWQFCQISILFKAFETIKKWGQFFCSLSESDSKLVFFSCLMRCHYKKEGEKQQNPCCCILFYHRWSPPATESNKGTFSSACNTHINARLHRWYTSFFTWLAHKLSPSMVMLLQIDYWRKLNRLCVVLCRLSAALP